MNSCSNSYEMSGLWYVCIAIILLILIVCLYQKYVAPNTGSENMTSESKQALNELVLYHTTWCGHSRAFLAEPCWDQLKAYANKNYDGNLNIKEIQCDGKDVSTYDNSCCNNKDLIAGFPTIILYRQNGDRKEAIKYDGPRNYDSIVAFIDKNIKK